MPSAKTGNYQVIEVEVKKQFTLYTLDNGEVLILSPSVAADFYLYRQKHLNEDDLKAIKLAQQKRQLFDYVVKKMRGHYISEAAATSLLFDYAENKSLIASVIKELKNKHYLDDERLAQSIIERLQNKLCGNDKIMDELKKARVKSEVVEQIHLSEVDELARGKEVVPLLEKKLQRISARSKKHKIYQQLLRLGYPRDVASDLLGHISEVDLEVEQVLLKRDYEKALKRYQKKYDKFELSRHILNYLLTKGYTYNDIKKVVEGQNYDMD